MRKIMMTLLLFVAMAANAVNITYSLTTHIDGRTITGSASVNSVDEITNKMPRALWRAYCTYKYYSDEAMTQEISVLPEEDATVYVDYVFDPPFILSKEGEDPVWHYIRAYNESDINSTGNQYILYKVHSKNEVNGWKTTNGSLPKAGNNLQMENKTHDEWAFYGDAYNLHIKLNDVNEMWLIWSGTSGSRKLSFASSKKSVGWQLYVNTAKNKKLPNGGTMCLGVPDVDNYIAEFENVNSGVRTNGIDTSDYYFDEHNQLKSKDTSTDHTNRNQLWWYAFFATPVSDGVPKDPKIWHVYYKILKEDGVNWYPDVIKAKSATTEQTPNIPDFTGKRSDCIYDGYYKDEEFTDKYASNEKMPITGNTIVYIREILNAVPFITDHWITMAISYNISDVNAEWNGGVRVLEYYDVKTNPENTKYDLKFQLVNTMEPHKPYLFKADKTMEGKTMKLVKDNNWYSKTEEELIKYVEDNKVQYKDVANNSPYVTFIATYLDKELTVQSEHPELLYFYFGYDNRYDKENEAYVGDDEAAGKYPYNFYRVTKKNVTIPKHRCYFYIKDEKTLPQLTFTALNFIEDVNGVSDQIYVEPSFSQSQGIYNINGQLISTNAENTEGLSKGLYIINGKKVVIR